MRGHVRSPVAPWLRIHAKMRGKTHISSALLAGVAGLKYGAFAVLPFGVGHGFLLLVALGAMLPDLDHPFSLIGRNIPIVARFVNFFFGHRGVLHSIVGLGLTLLGAFAVCHFLNIALTGMAVFALALGFVIHLIGDTLTRDGIKWLHPLHKMHIKGPLKSGGWIELGIFVFVSALLAKLVFGLGWNVIRFI